jgi:hypothetical protein
MVAHDAQFLQLLEIAPSSDSALKRQLSCDKEGFHGLVI